MAGDGRDRGSTQEKGEDWAEQGGKPSRTDHMLRIDHMLQFIGMAEGHRVGWFGVGCLAPISNTI